MEIFISRPFLKLCIAASLLFTPVLIPLSLISVAQTGTRTSSGKAGEPAKLGTMWTGTYGKGPLRLLLVRDGGKIIGWSWNACNMGGGPDGPALQIIGTMSDSEFRMEGESGCIFAGKVEGGNTLIGQNFQASLQREALPSDFPPPLPSTSSDWKVFLVRFTQAVQHRDRSALEKLMSPRFQLDYRHSPAPGDALNGIDAGFWTELSRAISYGAELRPGKKSPFVLEQRVAFTCAKCPEQGNVDFTKGLDGQWRWNGLFYAD